MVSTLVEERKRAKLFLTLIIANYVVQILLFTFMGNKLSPLANTALHMLSVAGYLLFFPIIAAAPSPTKSWARTAGYIWLIFDITATTMALYGVPASISTAMRFGGAHIAASVWVAVLSYEQKGWLMYVGLPLAAILTLFSFVRLWIPESLLSSLFPLFIIWLLLLRNLLSKK